MGFHKANTLVPSNDDSKMNREQIYDKIISLASERDKINDEILRLIKLAATLDE
jgi:hypothetical protein